MKEADSARRGHPILIGGILGLAAGVGLGIAHFDKQPHVYESESRLAVTGPGGTAASAEAEAAVVRSPRVIERAARKLEDEKPFEVAPPASPAEAAAFLEKNLSVQPAVAESALTLRFDAASRDDAPKYLRAIIESYRVEVEQRARGTPPPATSPGSATPAPSPSANLVAEIEANIARVKEKLAAVTRDPVSDIEQRLEKNRAELDDFGKREEEIDRTLAVIDQAGMTAAGRLAAMKKLGLAANADSGSLAQVEKAEEELKSLQAKKAELGRRLGPEHRDMVALDEDIQQVKAEIAKANAAPKRPDALDRLHAKLEADRAALAIAAGALRSAIEREEKTLSAAAPLEAELARLNKDRAAAAEKQPAGAAASPASANQTAALPSAGSVKVIEPPKEGVRIAPHLYRSLLPGGILGLLGGSLIGFLVAALASVTRHRVHRLRETASRPRLPALPKPSFASRAPTGGSPFRMPLLGRIPAIRTDLPAEKKSTEGLNPILVAFHRPGSAEAESFRQARRELTAALDGRGHQVIAVTSPDSGDGKSTAAANLAISLAQSGKRVIIVDCDLRTPAVQGFFRLTRLGDGLKSVMGSEVDLRMAVRNCEVANLYLLPAGRGDVDPADVLTRPKFRELIAELKSSYEFVILDVPPVTAEEELAALAGNVDGVVLVVRSGSDAVGRADRAKARIVAAGSQVIGAIETAAPPPPRTDLASPAPQAATAAPAAAEEPAVK